MSNTGQSRFKNIIVFFVLLITPTICGAFFVTHFFPKEISGFSKDIKKIVAEKLKKIADELIPSVTNVKSAKKNLKEKDPMTVENPSDRFKNKDVYEAICDVSFKENQSDEFFGCQRCPNYLNVNSNDNFFQSRFYVKGPVFKPAEQEVVFFMEGCLDDSLANSFTEKDHSVAVILRKGFGGWKRVAQFSGSFFESPPLSFIDEDGLLVFVGVKKEISEFGTKNTLSSLRFKPEQFLFQDFFHLQSSSSLKCQDQFLANMGDPVSENSSKFSITLDVLGWEKSSESQCKINARKKQVYLNPGHYKLQFFMKKNRFLGDNEAQKIITGIEKSQE